MRRPEALEIIKKILKKVAPDATVILYGSEARGDARPDSDFDLLILEETDHISLKRKKEILYPLMNLFYDFNINVQPILKTRYEWENRPFPTPFYSNVMKEGIIL